MGFDSIAALRVSLGKGGGKKKKQQISCSRSRAFLILFKFMIFRVFLFCEK